MSSANVNSVHGDEIKNNNNNNTALPVHPWLEGVVDVDSLRAAPDGGAPDAAASSRKEAASVEGPEEVEEERLPSFTPVFGDDSVDSRSSVFVGEERESLPRLAAAFNGKGDKFFVSGVVDGRGVDAFVDSGADLTMSTYDDAGPESGWRRLAKPFVVRGFTD